MISKGEIFICFHLNLLSPSLELPWPDCSVILNRRHNICFYEEWTKEGPAEYLKISLR